MLLATTVINYRGFPGIAFKGKGIFWHISFDIEVTTDIEVIFVPVIFQDVDGYSPLHGLILQSTGGKSGEFERIGLLTVYKDQGYTGQRDTGWLKLEAVLEKFGESTAREHCAETRIDPETGKEQFVITII